MKLIPAFFQAIYVSYNSLPVSDQIQLLGIIASLVVSIVAIVISLATLHQNSKMLESASRPIVSMYIDSITVCEQTSYFVLKNFGASPAKITTFKYDSILKETTPAAIMLYLSDLTQQWPYSFKSESSQIRFTAAFTPIVKPTTATQVNAPIFKPAIANIGSNMIPIKKISNTHPATFLTYFISFFLTPLSSLDHLSPLRLLP